MHKKPDFGDYVRIEQKRFGVPNEMYVYKVIGRLHSTAWVEVPRIVGAGEVLHKTGMEECVRCIQCGIDETRVETFRLADVALTTDTSFS